MTELRNDLAYFTPHKGHKRRKLYERTKKKEDVVITTSPRFLNMYSIMLRTYSIRSGLMRKQ